jgi:hypothetical protein
MDKVPTGPRRSPAAPVPGSCYNFLYAFQWHAFGAPSRPAQAETRERCARACTGEALNEPGRCRAVAAKGDGDSRRRWRGSLARRFLRGSAPARAAARRAAVPHPGRNAPRGAALRELAGRSSSRQVHRSPCERPQLAVRKATARRA